MRVPAGSRSARLMVAALFIEFNLDEVSRRMGLLDMSLSEDGWLELFHALNDVDYSCHIQQIGVITTMQRLTSNNIDDIRQVLMLAPNSGPHLSKVIDQVWKTKLKLIEAEFKASGKWPS